jgi:hypothetical protein
MFPLKPYLRRVSSDPHFLNQLGDQCRQNGLKSLDLWKSGVNSMFSEEKNGGRNWIRTSEGVSQQIYSLPPLATWVSYQIVEDQLWTTNGFGPVSARCNPGFFAGRKIITTLLKSNPAIPLILEKKCPPLKRREMAFFSKCPN